MFEQEQKVFYPKYGVGKIVGVDELQSSDGNYLSYIISFEVTKEKVSLPVSEAPRLGLRELGSEEQVKETLGVFSQSIAMNIEESWKERKKEIEDLFARGDLKSLGILVKTLFERHQFRPLGARERQIYELAYDFLVSEIALITQNSEPSVEHEISEQILKSRTQAGDFTVL